MASCADEKLLERMKKLEKSNRALIKSVNNLYAKMEGMEIDYTSRIDAADEKIRELTDKLERQTECVPSPTHESLMQRAERSNSYTRSYSNDRTSNQGVSSPTHESLMQRAARSHSYTRSYSDDRTFSPTDARSVSASRDPHFILSHEEYTDDEISFTWTLSNVRFLYQQAKAEEHAYITMSTPPTMYDEEGYKYELHVQMNGGPGKYTWNKFLCVAVVASNIPENRRKRWPINRRIAISLLSPEDDTILLEEPREQQFSGPKSRLWIFNFCKLNKLLGVCRDFNTEFIDDDCIKINVEISCE